MYASRESSMRNRCRQTNPSLTPPPGTSNGSEGRSDWAGLVNPRPRILLAEDDVIVREMLFNWLDKMGYEVEVAKDGEEAWKILDQNGSPELVILGWMTPGIDGMEICRKLRSKQSEFYHYVLLITARSNKQDIAFALEAGADDYLVKPFDLDELSSRLAVANRIVSVQHQLIKARENLRVQATKDGLTGVWNRVTFLNLFESELDRASRSGATTGLLMLDIDHFKKINDRFGHLSGDLVLKEIADRLKRFLRSYDFLGRYGGEEFMIALPGVTKAQLHEIAERIRLSIANEPVSLNASEINITLSIGAADVTPGRKNPIHAIAVADVALYHAKNMGRNCTVACQKPWLEVVQSDCNSHSLCSSCIRNLAANSCIVESKSSHSDSLKMRKLWNIFPLESGMPAMGDMRS